MTCLRIRISPARSSICGTSVSAVTYYRRVRPDPTTVIPLALLAFAGSLIGALLASRIPKAAFNPLILVVLIGVGAYTLSTPRLGREIKHNLRKPVRDSYRGRNSCRQRTRTLLKKFQRLDPIEPKSSGFVDSK